MSRQLSWFATQNGRRFTYFCVGTAAAAVFGNKIAINGPLLDRLKQICQVYRIGINAHLGMQSLFERHGEPRLLPPKVNSMIKEVLQESTLKEEEKKKVKFFYVVGHDLFHAGGINSPWGAIVGIPFTFEDVNDINFSDLKIQGKESIDWVIDGQDLIKALTITDNAKKFALMRELYSCNFSHVFQNALIGGCCILLSARFAQMVNTKRNALEKVNFPKRSIYYILCYSMGYILYHCFKNPLKHLSDKEADKLAAETGLDYLNGGIEYYKKILMKHKALKELPDSLFKNSFDDQGNENYFILAPKLPITKRLEFLRNMKKEKFNEI